MKSIRKHLYIALAALLIGCAPSVKEYNVGSSGAAEDRRLIVAFVDRTINRNIPGNGLDSYRSRGSYGNSTWSQRLVQQMADRYQLRLIAQWPVTTLGVSCVVFDVPEQFSVQQTMAELQKDHDVALVQPMNTFVVEADNVPVFSAQHRDPYLSLQAGFKVPGIADLRKSASGKGIRIAIIDSGVDVGHPDLRGQIKYLQNVAPEPEDHNLADMHGTAVAGILSALPDNDIGIAGIVPDAEILAFRACWPDKPDAAAAQCNSFTLALALNEAIRLQSHIINLSLSGPEDPLLRQLIDKAIEQGIVVIAAVPGKGKPGGFPANVSGVLAVGRGNEDERAEIIAPGKDILTTVPHGGYDFMTGSSFATPHVAGMVAMLLELHPTWQVADVKQYLSADSKLAFVEPLAED